MKALFTKLKNGYVHFVEKQGFPIIVTLCVAVITVTALWTADQEEVYVSPTPPVIEHVSAAQLLQQSLRDAATPTPAPTTAPRRWCAPLDTTEVIRPFDIASMVQGESGIWAIHDAVDLTTESGAKVYAIADGEVIATGRDKLQGVWITIDHGNGYEARYVGMALLCDYIPGDEVRMGDTIGFAGNTLADERHLGPHLHLRVTKEGQAVDPCTLWDSPQQ